MRNFDQNEFPLAYLITFRCYGSWLHGDARGSFKREYGISSTTRVSPNEALERAELKQLQHPPVTLTTDQRLVVGAAVRHVCEHRKYQLRGINVRTNHVHVVVSAFHPPERILNDFKAYSTRALREAGLLSSRVKPWSRHGSTIYLWKELDVEKAMVYVLLGQGNDLLRLD
jgi:REP element-mobilizing transposase RayT